MLIRQRRTVLDPILLDVVFPFLRGKGLDHILRFGHIWNQPVNPVQQPAPVPVLVNPELRRTNWREAEEIRLRLTGPAAKDLAHQKP